MSQELPKAIREGLARQAVGDTHPSPDVLTAFMEHSLTGHESQQITDHLAKCTDCREAVFLASGAVEESAGEEQELMPEVAVPRISPALQAKTVDPRSAAGAGQAKKTIPDSPRRESRWRWAWVPVAAAALLVSALLVQRSQLVKNVPQPSEMIARKEPPPSANSAQPTAVLSAAPESPANLVRQKPFPKSAPARGNPASASGTSSVVAPRAAGQLPSVLGERAALEPPGSPPPNAAILEYKQPAAIPRQNSFVASDAQKPSTLALRSQPASEKPQMGLLPAVVTSRQWRVTPDGRLEHSTARETWTPVLADQPAKFRAVAVVGDNVWAGGRGGVLFHSTDGGQTWKKNQVSEAASVETDAIVSIRFSDEQHGVITTDAGSLWSTPDGGATWTKQ